jgi:hypothetical protein
MVPAGAVHRRAIIIPPKPAPNYLNASGHFRAGLSPDLRGCRQFPVAAGFLRADWDDIIGGRMPGQGEIMDAVFELDDNFCRLANGIFG